MFEGTS